MFVICKNFFVLIASNVMCSGQRHAGAGAGSSVEFLGRGMVGMQLRDAKPDADDEIVPKGYVFI